MERQTRNPKYLSIIIPEYKPDPAMLFNNLASIANQLNVNFNNIEVILINDADGQPIPQAWLQIFPFLNIVTAVMEENGGPGLARQLGIDIAVGDYVMFMDADDRLYDPQALSAMLTRVYAEYREETALHWDICLTNWLEEVKTPNAEEGGVLYPDRFEYVPHENDGTWMHGKMYRRQFLIDNNIRFDDMRVHEDRRFNIIALNCSAKTISFAQPYTYLWRFNPNSIVRRNDAEYSYTSMVEASDAAYRAYTELMDKHSNRLVWAVYDINELEKMHKVNLSREIAQNIYYIYFMCQGWHDVIKPELMQKIEHALARFYVKFKKYFDAYPAELKAADYAIERQIAVTQCRPFIERESANDFLNRIAQDYLVTQKP